jgi:asparagine N-glycosylation enzyme membrane subunit Stt3
VSFGFFQPLFLGSLAGGTILIDTLLRAVRGQLSRGEALRRGAILGAAAAALLPFAAPLVLGLARGVGYVVGRTSEVAGASGYVSYPRDWLKGIFEARPLFADGPGLAWRQLSAAFFLAPGAVVLWLVRWRRGESPGVHATLAVWGAVTLLLAVSQRLNVYYAAVFAGATLVEAGRLLRDLALKRGASPRLSALASAAAVFLLASPSLAALPAELRTVRVPGSDLFGTLDWMRRELPHEVDAYDPRFLQTTASGTATPSAAASVLAPWSLGHMVLYRAELPVVANNFGYGFIDSLRFFLAETESEALAIAKERRARWVLVTDLVPRMNDYASYLGRPPLLERRGGELAPKARYFSTMQSRLYDFDGAGERLGSETIPPLTSFRLRYHSKSAIRRGSAWLARWKVFEIVPGGEAAGTLGLPFAERSALAGSVAKRPPAPASPVH